MNLITPTTVTDVRRRICSDCEHRRRSKLRGYYCGKCGCNLAAKTRLMRARCPLGLW